MTGLIADTEDSTPLTQAESRGLLVPVQTRAELNRAEAESISGAVRWLFLSRRRLRSQAVLNEEWLRRLHQRMYGSVWAWAGMYRTEDRNLGVPFWQVRIDIRTTVADARAWLADDLPGHYSDDESAIRLGYRLVVIHPFPNGNGRWSRLVSDALIVALGGSRFSWGGSSLAEPSELRRDYIAALQVADMDGDIRPLVSFARR